MVSQLWLLIIFSLDLANLLYDQGDFYDAVTEYERFLFYNPADSLAGYARYRLACAYSYAGEPDRAEAILRDLSGDSIWGYEAQSALAELYRRELRYQEARWALEDLLLRHPDDGSIYEELGLVELYAKNPARAAQYFLDAGDNVMAQKAQSLLNLSQKNPQNALLLSTLLPGLGELYSGQYRIGISAFLVNLISLGGIAVSLKAGKPVDALLIGLIFFNRFYQGSRYNAYHFACKFNQKVYEQSLHQLGLDIPP